MKKFIRVTDILTCNLSCIYLNYDISDKDLIDESYMIWAGDWITGRYLLYISTNLTNYSSSHQNSSLKASFNCRFIYIFKSIVNWAKLCYNYI